MDPRMGMAGRSGLPTLSTGQTYYTVESLQDLDLTPNQIFPPTAGSTSVQPQLLNQSFLGAAPTGQRMLLPTVELPNPNSVATLPQVGLPNPNAVAPNSIPHGINWPAMLDPMLVERELAQVRMRQEMTLRGIMEREAGIMGREPAPQSKVEGGSPPPLQDNAQRPPKPSKDKAPKQKAPKQTLAGTKRKTEVGDHASVLRMLSHGFPVSDRRGDPYCHVCQVHCSSMEGVKNHLQEKKHKSKMDEYHEAVEDKGVVQREIGSTLELWCKKCEIRCSAHISMYQHLMGRRHVTRVKELEGAKKGKDEQVAGAEGKDAKKAKAEQVEGTEEKDAKKAKVEKDAGTEGIDAKKAKAEQITGTEGKDAKKAKPEQITGTEGNSSARKERETVAKMDVEKDKGHNRAESVNVKIEEMGSGSKGPDTENAEAHIKPKSTDTGKLQQRDVKGPKVGKEEVHYDAKNPDVKKEEAQGKTEKSDVGKEVAHSGDETVNVQKPVMHESGKEIAKEIEEEEDEEEEDGDDEEEEEDDGDDDDEEEEDDDDDGDEEEDEEEEEEEEDDPAESDGKDEDGEDESDGD